jgi:hypothetical protein
MCTRAVFQLQRVQHRKSIGQYGVGQDQQVFPARQQAHQDGDRAAGLKAQRTVDQVGNEIVGLRVEPSDQREKRFHRQYIGSDHCRCPEQRCTFGALLCGTARQPPGKDEQGAKTEAAAHGVQPDEVGPVAALEALEQKCIEAEARARYERCRAQSGA